MSDKLQCGKLKFFDKAKGYGFIKPTVQHKSGKDVYLHSAELKNSEFEGVPDEGDDLLFEIEEREKGPRAVNISRG